MKYEIITTDIFDKWLSKLKDRQAVKAIALRIARAEEGNFGDAEPVGSGISEMRIFVGKGYRIYFTVHNNRIVLLLNGGIKSNKKQQQVDIARAKQILSEIEDSIMGIKTKPFNPFDYMDSQAEIDVYLLECFNDDDPQLFINALGHLAKHHGMTEVAKAAGLNRESLYKAFNGKTQPKWDTVHRLMKVLHVDLTVTA